MGGLISLPGAADQAIHADTPHLFETIDCLPAHYINAFAPGWTTDPTAAAAAAAVGTDKDGCFTGCTDIGGTAFVHGSHRLSFTADVVSHDEGRSGSIASQPNVLENLVRPSLQLGDVLLFDCRILHFGLANNSKTVERALLYTNMTQAWFHDPKNWDAHQPIFPLSSQDKLQSEPG
uniref:Phytanoyl-CoA dioxygenase n=1 Tax=Cyclophora tenuis TaxID=216820 RepID=A0A7S1GPF1_CYCTE|mmetsp:Transcript_4039/g.6908  ORF Transcript_4039/g.6908 Transcript_4039/m.6908 type:complete len:177 (+) Transcript_4039:182-712(+)